MASERATLSEFHNSPKHSVFSAWNLALAAWSIKSPCCFAVSLYALFAKIPLMATYEDYPWVAEILSKIYDPFRLEDELDLPVAAKEEHKQKVVSIMDVFIIKEIQLAFLAGGGLMVISSYSTVEVCCFHCALLVLPALLVGEG